MSEPSAAGDQAYRYDVFISYSHKDGEWVRDWLLPRLEAAGLRVCIDFRDFEVGLPSLVNMERAAERSRKMLLVLTPNWIASEWTNFEALLMQTEDPSGLRRRILPLMLARCEPPKRIAMLTYADFTASAHWEREIPRLIRALGAEAGQPEYAAQSPPLKASPEVDQEQAHVRELLTTKRRRLHALELQAAKYGIAAPPHVTIEIEDLRWEIAELEARL